MDEYILCKNPFLDSRNRGSTGRLYPTNPLNKIRKILLAILKAFFEHLYLQVCLTYVQLLLHTHLQKYLQ